MSRKIKTDRGGIITTVGLDVAEQERLEREKDERNQAFVNERVKNAPRVRGPRVAVEGTEDSTTREEIVRNTHFPDSMRGAPILHARRIFIGPQYPGGWHAELWEADYEAVVAGKYCQRCLRRQHPIKISDICCPDVDLGVSCGTPKPIIE